MLTFFRTHWRRVSTGLLALTLLGAGGSQAYQALRGACCHHTSPGK
jgi:hypothetical protein